MKTKLTILGCGSSEGVPRIDGFWGNCKKNNKKNHRSRCSAIINKGENSVLIDTSADLKQQLLSNKIKNGLFELRPFFWKYKKKINIYGNLKTINSVKKRHNYLFKKIGIYNPIVQSKIIGSKFSLGKSREKIFFKAINVKHGNIKSTAYIFEKTAYLSDTNDLSIIKMKQFKNLKYLIIDCLQFKKHRSHLCLDESLLIHRYLKPKKTILTNLKHELDYHYLLKILPKDVIPAYDGLKISL